MDDSLTRKMMLPIRMANSDFLATALGSLILGLIMGFLFFVLGLIASNALTEKTVKEMMEERSPEECICLMEYLQKYCNAWGCKVKQCFRK